MATINLKAIILATLLGILVNIIDARHVNNGEYLFFLS